MKRRWELTSTRKKNRINVRHLKYKVLDHRMAFFCLFFVCKRATEVKKIMLKTLNGEDNWVSWASWVSWVSGFHGRDSRG